MSNLTIAFVYQKLTHSRHPGLVRFALGYGLHEINPLDYVEPRGVFRKRDLGPQAASTDVFHIAERINLWWSIYLLSQRVAIMNGSPEGSSELQVEVMFKFSLSSSTQESCPKIFPLEDQDRASREIRVVATGTLLRFVVRRRQVGLPL